MKIHYLQTRCCNEKLFSCSRHDFRKCSCGQSYIDGGFDYCKVGGKDNQLEQEEVKDLINIVREQFTWGQNYNKDGTRLEKTEYKLLKDLSSDHILGILSYFNNKAYKIIVEMQELENYPVTDKSYHITQEIFIQELIYRNGNQ